MDIVILIASLLVLAAILSTRFAQRFGVPALVLFVGIGMLAGSSGPGGIAFDNYALSLNVGFLALAVILLSGGLDTNVRLFKASVLPGALLATLGVFIKTLLLGGVAYAVTYLSFPEALLLGAVLAPTDAAAVFSVLKGKGLPSRLRGILETESSTNDPVSIYLTIALAGFLSTGQASAGGLLGGVVLQLVLGGVVGVVAGRLLTTLVNRVSVGSFGLYPVMVLAGGMLTYALANLVGGNGFLAIFLVGLVLTSQRVTYRQNIQHFMDSAAWGAQIVMFLLLGLLSFPDRLMLNVFPGLMITVGALIIARPASVVITLWILRRFTKHYAFNWKEQLLISWAGLKGAVPIILAIVPLLNSVSHGEFIFDVVFVVVIIGTAVQGLTVVPLARWLNLLKAQPPEAPIYIELGGAAPPGSGVLHIFLDDKNNATGKRIQDLTLPDDLLIAAIYRHDKLITPRGQETLQQGDHLFIISNNIDDPNLPNILGRSKSKTTDVKPDTAGAAP